MERREIYKQGEISKAEIHRMQTIGYPAYVSEKVLTPFTLQDKKVLDSGAGPNPKLAEFVEKKGGRYVPLDLRPDALKAMRTALESEGLPFFGVQADVRNLPFADNSFDVVHQRFVLMNIAPETRDQALKELLRVAKEKVVLLEYNWRTLHSTAHPEVVERFKDLAFRMFSKFSTDPYMGEQFEALLKKVGANLTYTLEHFKRAEDEANTAELILNVKSFQAAPMDDAFKAEAAQLAADLEETPVAFVPPEIVAVTITK